MDDRPHHDIADIMSRKKSVINQIKSMTAQLGDSDGIRIAKEDQSESSVTQEAQTDRQTDSEEVKK